MLRLDDGVSLSDLCSAVMVWRKKKRKEEKNPQKNSQAALAGSACVYFLWLVTLLQLMNSERELWFLLVRLNCLLMAGSLGRGNSKVHLQSRGVVATDRLCLELWPHTATAHIRWKRRTQIYASAHDTTKQTALHWRLHIFSKASYGNLMLPLIFIVFKLLYSNKSFYNRDISVG